MRGGGAVALAGLGACVLLAAGVGIGAVLIDTPDSPSVASQTGATTVAVAVMDYDGARDQVFSTVLGAAVPLSVSDAGRITHSTCVPGAPIASGDTPFTIDDRPVFALETSIPLWRDLSKGAEGEDVKALQGALSALGYAVDADGLFGRATTEAVKAFFTDRGVAKPAGVVSASSFMWLPQSSVTIGSCEVAVGDQADGGPLATTAGGLQALKPVDSPTDDVTGAVRARVFRYGDLTASAGDDGLVTDPAFIAAVGAGAEFAYSETPEGGGRLTLTSVLAEPLKVAVLPPGAIYDVVGGIGCVIGDGKPVPVTVIASALGQSSVAFDAEVPSQVAVTPDAEAGGCR